MLPISLGTALQQAEDNSVFHNLSSPAAESRESFSSHFPGQDLLFHKSIDKISTAIFPFGQRVEECSLTTSPGDSPEANQCLSQASSFTSWFPTNSFSSRENLIFFPEKHMQISFLCFLLKHLFLLRHPPQSVSSLDVFWDRKLKGKIQKKNIYMYMS